MKPSKGPRQHETHEKNAESRGNNISRGSQIEASHAANKHVTNRQIPKSPKYVDRGRRESLAARFRKRTLKGMPRHAAYEMRNRVGKKSAAKEVGRIIDPFHLLALLF